jgi:phytoene/squalene synthetase
MPDTIEISDPSHLSPQKPETDLAAAITKAASKQTYYTIRFLVDRNLIQDAYRAYAYFRWVDDYLDAEMRSPAERSAFIQRQQSLLEACYRGDAPGDLSVEERWLADLISADDGGKDSGLQSYIRNLMDVMVFDAGRLGRVISQAELNAYTHSLAIAVTEAMHYFIGHCCYSPHDGARYLAVTAAHITHMLRDTFDDIQAGYFNIPREVLEAHHIAPQDVHSQAYRDWARSRVQLARKYFKAGRAYLHQVESLRCRLAGFAYTARFEWLLDIFERESYHLRPNYDERKNFSSGLQMSWLVLTSLANPLWIREL